MGRRCSSENMVYPANIFPIENCKDEKIYIRISSGNWKQSNPLLLALPDPHLPAMVASDRVLSTSQIELFFYIQTV